LNCGSLGATLCLAVTWLAKGAFVLTFDWKKLRILLVDGDDQFRFWARGLFKQQRAAEVISLPLVEDAREALCQYGADVALIELGRNDIALVELMRWLRQSKSSPCADLPLLLMVKDMAGDALREVCGLGVHGVLKKPVTGELMLKAVQSVCRNPRRVAVAPAPVSRPHPAPTLAETPPELSHHRREAPASAGPKPVPLRRLSSSLPPPDGVAARPPSPVGTGVLPIAHGGAGLDVADAASKRGGTYGDEALEPFPAKPKEFFEAAEAAPPKPKAEDDGWSDASSTKSKTKPGGDAFEPPAEPKPNDGQPVAGRDLDAILEEHALWVKSGGTQGKRANLEGEDLSGRTLAEAPLTNASLRRCDLSGSDFTKAELHGADLRHAEIIGGQMKEANLAVARLRHAHLRGCRMEGVNLKGADLAGADLSGSVFDGADLKGANLLGVLLAGADLSGAKGMTQAQLESATGDAKTKLPPGLRLLPAPSQA